jgi:hypothetical protein
MASSVRVVQVFTISFGPAKPLVRLKVIAGFERDYRDLDSNLLIRRASMGLPPKTFTIPDQPQHHQQRKSAGFFTGGCLNDRVASG